MKNMIRKIFLLTTSFIFIFNNFSYANNYDAYKAYLKGLLAQKSGNVDLAKSEYEKVVAYDQDAIAVYKELANIYWQSGNGKKALEVTKKLQELDGDSVKTNMFLGAFYLSANEPLLAKQSWEKVLQLEPDNEMATVYLAAYYYSDNQLKESVDYWNKFLQQQPESAEGYFQLGLVQEKLGMLDEALASYKKVNELKTEAKEAYLARARIYESKKQFSSAIEEYEKYIAVFPDNVSILLYLSKCYFEERRYPKAQETLLKAKKIAPQNITIYYLLGMTYEKQENISKAIESFEYIAKQEPNHSVFARLGYYYALNQDYKNAEKNFLKAIEMEPLNYEYMYLLGLNYIDSKKYDKAKDALNKALAFNPESTKVKFYLAAVYDELKEFPKAEKLLEEILAAEPNNAKALNFLGYNYAQKNIKLEKAQELLLKAVSLYPNEPAYLDSLAWLYYRLGKYNEAEQFMFKAINTQPKLFDKTLYEHLGDISVELNKLPQAWLSYAISCDLGSKDSKKKMGLVEKKCSILKENIDKMFLQRALHNYVRLSCLKTDYKLKISKNNVKLNSLVKTLYAKNYGVDCNFIQSFAIPSFNVLISNGEIKFLPQSTKQMLDDDITDMLDFIKFILSNDFLSFFDTAKMQKKGNKLIYSNDQYRVTIDKKNGTFKEFEKINLIKIKISSYENINKISKIPSVISISSKKIKFDCDVKLNKKYNFTVNDLKSRQLLWEQNETSGTGKN